MKVHSRIIQWIRKQEKETQTKGVVIGISGGIDSAVTAALCSRALGRKKVLGLILPCESQKQDIKDAYLVVNQLQLRAQCIDLSSLYKSYLRILPQSNSVVQGNLKARLRMLTLYYFANLYNSLVCGTSNKSETLVGYFTKYGDGAADILPIGDLLKTQVRKLAYELKIPEKIINKPPTAGLWLNQTDESELGMTYVQLDDVLFCIEKGKKQIQPIPIVKKVESRITSSGHKRELPRVCKL